MLTVKGKTIVFLTAGERSTERSRRSLADNHQTGPTGSSTVPSSKQASKPDVAIKLGTVVAQLADPDQ